MQVLELEYTPQTEQLVYWLLKLGHQRIDVRFEVVDNGYWYVGFQKSTITDSYVILYGKVNRKYSNLTPDIVKDGIKYICNSYSARISYDKVKYVD